MSSTPAVQLHRPDIYPKNFKIMMLEEHLKTPEQFLHFVSFLLYTYCAILHHILAAQT